MPKFTDLPVAVVSKDNDIICIVDPDADVSAQMTVGTLRDEIIVPSYLGGTVAPIPLPINGGAIQFLDTFSKSRGVNSDAAAGTIDIPDSGDYELIVSLNGQSNFATNSDGQFNNLLFGRVDDGVGGVTDTIIAAFSSWVKNELVYWTVSGQFLTTIVGSPTTTVSFGVQVIAGEDPVTYIISSSAFFLEKV